MSDHNTRNRDSRRPVAGVGGGSGVGGQHGPAAEDAALSDSRADDGRREHGHREERVEEDDVEEEEDAENPHGDLVPITLALDDEDYVQDPLKSMLMIRPGKRAGKDYPAKHSDFSKFLNAKPSLPQLKEEVTRRMEADPLHDPQHPKYRPSYWTADKCITTLGKMLLKPQEQARAFHYKLVPKRSSSASESQPPSAASLPDELDQAEETVNGDAAGGKKSIRWVRSKDGILFVNCLIYLRSGFAEHFKNADRRTLDEKNTNKFWQDMADTFNGADGIEEQDGLLLNEFYYGGPTMLVDLGTSVDRTEYKLNASAAKLRFTDMKTELMRRVVNHERSGQGSHAAHEEGGDEQMDEDDAREEDDLDSGYEDSSKSQVVYSADFEDFCQSSSTRGEGFPDLLYLYEAANKYQLFSVIATFMPPDASHDGTTASDTSTSSFLSGGSGVGGKNQQAVNALAHAITEATAAPVTVKRHLSADEEGLMKAKRKKAESELEESEADSRKKLRERIRRLMLELKEETEEDLQADIQAELNEAKLKLRTLTAASNAAAAES